MGCNTPSLNAIRKRQRTAAVQDADATLQRAGKGEAFWTTLREERCSKNNLFSAGSPQRFGLPDYAGISIARTALLGKWSLRRIIGTARYTCGMDVISRKPVACRLHKQQNTRGHLKYKLRDVGVEIYASCVTERTEVTGAGGDTQHQEHDESPTGPICTFVHTVQKKRDNGIYDVHGWVGVRPGSQLKAPSNETGDDKQYRHHNLLRRTNRSLACRVAIHAANVTFQNILCQFLIPLRCDATSDYHLPAHSLLVVI